MRLIIVCVETNKRAKTDVSYINKAIRYFYDIDNNEVRLYFKYYDSKKNYADKKKLKEIIEDCKAIGKEKSTVLFCVDTDEYENSIEDIKLNSEIQKFCQQNLFRFTWFCRDVEEVFLHKQVHQNEKVQESKRFARTKGIGKANENDLKAINFSKRKSNLLNNLDDILSRKK